MRTEFPLLNNHPELVYLDSAATALKPAAVIEAERDYSERYGTNAARGLYPLAEATDAVLRETRAAVARFLNAAPEEIIFTRGTTDGLNMLADSFTSLLQPSDEIVITALEHHSNLLPWTELSRRTQAKIRMAENTPEGFIDAVSLASCLTPRTRIVALSFVSNVFGVINDLDALTKIIRSQAPEALIVIDAAQAVSHIPIHVSALDVDALVFSGHKIYGPTGVGVLFLSQKWQEKLPPSRFGGGMVLDPLANPPVWKKGPEKFEAGTLPLGQIFGLREALAYVEKTGFKKIHKHEEALLDSLFMKLESAFGQALTVLGTRDTEYKIGLVSFAIEGVHPHDIAGFLGEQGIAVRAGTHCAGPLHERLSLSATTRVSFGLYTTEADLDRFVAALRDCVKALAR